MRALGAATALSAVAAAAVYFVGGALLALRLGLAHLPSSSVVPQLPRDFLFSIGLSVVLPAVLLGAGVLAFGALRRRPLRRLAPLAVAVTAIAGLAVSGGFVAKRFETSVCTVSGDRSSGIFVGETSERIYIGETKPGKKRIVSVPLSRVAQVFVGGGAAELSCPGPRLGRGVAR